MPRMASIPPAISKARSRVEFKLEIVGMFKNQIEHLTNERNMHSDTSPTRKEIERAIMELRTFRMEIESLEFKVDTRINPI